MEIKYLILYATLLLMIWVVIILLEWIPSDGYKPKKSINNIIKKVKSGGAASALFVLVVAIIFVFFFYLHIKPLKIDLAERVFPGMIGMLFNILIVVVLLTFINERAGKKKQIDRYFEELYDYKGWDEKAAAYRVKGLINRIEKEGEEHRIKLQDLHLGMCSEKYIIKSLQENIGAASLEGIWLYKHTFNNILSFRANMSNGSLYRCEFKDSTLIDAKFNNTKLKKAHFYNCYLNESDFQDCYLYESDFKDSNLYIDNQVKN